MLEHTIVYREPGRFAGWPANYGIWSWPRGAQPDEIVVGFVAGSLKVPAAGHACDPARPFVTLQARSLDGGLTWATAPMPVAAPGGRALSADEHVGPALRAATALAAGEPAQPGPCPGVDFSRPDFALLCGRTGLEAGAVSWFYTSQDRCRSWQGPYTLGAFGLPGIAARTDYLVLGPHDLLLVLTAAKTDGREGRPFCIRTADGGRTWRFVSWIGPEPDGFAIMPASVRIARPGLPDAHRIVTAIRCRGAAEGGAERAWIDLYTSDDEGESWQYMGRPVAHTGSWGNPPALIGIAGQPAGLCLTYGYRDAPYGIRARLSRDGGETWGVERVLRANGGNRDLGYPRTVQRSDGRFVTVYYFNDAPDGERYIAATIWD